MIGLDRTKKEVWIAATHDEEGRQITPPRAFRYDTLVIAVGSVTNDFGTPVDDDSRRGANCLDGNHCAGPDGA